MLEHEPVRRLNGCIGVSAQTNSITAILLPAALLIFSTGVLADPAADASPAAADNRLSRRDEPLRELNLSDTEVRQIQSIAWRVFPGAILNISGVVSGCPCEEGPSCTDQVWIVAHGHGEALGLELSRIYGRWTVGTVQQYWLDLAMHRLYARYPVCTTPRDEYVAARD